MATDRMRPTTVPTRARPVVERLHGVDVADPYRWLEDGDDPEVRRWTEAQNAATRDFLDRVAGRDALEARLRALHEIGALGVPVSRGHGGGRRIFQTRRDGRQNQPVLYVRDGVDGADRVLVDVNAERADGTRALDWWFPSDDGARVAYGVSDDGSEESILRVRDVATRRDSDDIPRTRACSLAWTPDGGGFYYTRNPSPGEVAPERLMYHRAVFFHRLGDDPARDREVFGAGRDPNDWPTIALSPDGRWLAISVDQGWSRSEIHVADVRAGGPPIALVAGEEAQFQVVGVRDDRIFLFTTSGAPRGRLYAVDPARPARAAWRLLIPEGDDVLERVVCFRGGLAAAYLHEAAARLRLVSDEGVDLGEVALPDLGRITDLSADPDGPEIFHGFTSFFRPAEIFRTTVAPGGAVATELWARLPAPVDADDYTVERAFVTLKGGARAPLFFAHKKGAPRDGTRPAYLLGYGGFDISMLPIWTPGAIPFLERGGTFALAVLRGGGEYGEDWHRAGQRERKQNVFDDFIAAAEWLIDNRITRADRLAISGRSNGGLLMGAVLTQRPELFRAVVCGVPILDMLRFHRFRIAGMWTPEYGSPDDPEAFQWLRAYSPYHNVRDGAAYPAVYLSTADTDTRVDPMHARKMAARLQAAQLAADRPILLWVEPHAGHGAGKPLAKTIEQLTDEWAFVFSELGVG